MHFSLDPKPVVQACQSAEETVTAMAWDLLHTAKKHGVNVTIMRKPLVPLAMGHTDYEVCVWPMQKR